MHHRSISNSAARVFLKRRTLGVGSLRCGDGIAAGTRHDHQREQHRPASHAVVARVQPLGKAVTGTGIARNGPAIRHGSNSSSSNNPGVSDRGGALIPVFGKSSEFLHLPPADPPVGAQLYRKFLYCPSTRILRTSMHVGTTDANGKADGVVGDTCSKEDAKIHARNSGLRLLATVHAALDGDLGRVEQVLHLRGMVKSTPCFSGHASVIDGCSEVLAEALGPEAGVGTRECLGVGSLGASVACTLELRVRPSNE